MRESRGEKFPLALYVPVDAPPPSLDDNTGDIDRLKQALDIVLQKKDVSGRLLVVPFKCTGKVASRFRQAGFCGFALVSMLPSCIEIVDFFSDEPLLLPAFALDLGTTHLEGSLLDLKSGSILAVATVENSQVAYGSDILSRIHFTAGSKKEETGGEAEKRLQVLQSSVTVSINALIRELSRRADVKQGEIRAVSVSGNTTMVHLFLGLSPFHLCREPYIPLINDPDPCHASDLKLDVSAMAPVWILPSIGSYFGGDLVSGILASGLDGADATSMLIDVGTNAEVVLGNKDWMIACAGAAGPALEGGVARMGMRAGTGAIEHVAIDREKWTLNYTTIDNTPAAGICGSGLIDLVAELYLSELIDFRGRIRNDITPGSQEHALFLQQRLCPGVEGNCFIVAQSRETFDNQSVSINQVDLDAIIRSKAAMYAILTTLVSQVGIRFEELDRIYVAGAFGKHIDPRQAIILGMLPDLPISTYESIGNSSLRGAESILLSEECRRRSKEIRQRITYVELNVNQEFMIRFSGSRVIPHTDPSLFPTVPVFTSGISG